jgi:hypothetical protein
MILPAGALLHTRRKKQAVGEKDALEKGNSHKKREGEGAASGQAFLYKSVDKV